MTNRARSARGMRVGLLCLSMTAVAACGSTAAGAPAPTTSAAGATPSAMSGSPSLPAGAFSTAQHSADAALATAPVPPSATATPVAGSGLDEPEVPACSPIATSSHAWTSTSTPAALAAWLTGLSGHRWHQATQSRDASGTKTTVHEYTRRASDPVADLTYAIGTVDGHTSVRADAVAIPQGASCTSSG